MSMTFSYVPVSLIEHCRCLLREEEFEHSSMRKASGRAWAVCEASPSKNEQPLTFVLRAPSRFFLQFTFSEMRIMIRAHSQPAEWLPVSIAPSDADLQVCVMDYDGIVHAQSPYYKTVQSLL